MKKFSRILKCYFLVPIALFLLLGFYSCKQESDDSKAEALPVKEEVVEVDLNNEKEAVIAHMKKYKDAFQSLSVNGTMELFSEDSQVYESGGIEGTYENYVEHHIGPELDHFNSFTFSDYTIDVQVDLPYAFTTETYNYNIDLKENKEKNRPSRIIQKKGVATSILKKENNAWKIIKTHSSSRDIR